MYTIDASSHSATMIFLHGLGDTGMMWSVSLGKLGLNHVKFICPTAPMQSVTLNGGFQVCQINVFSDLEGDRAEPIRGGKSSIKWRGP